jgi:glycosyltransferase involved in cell wall biosynthesis
MWLLQAFRDPEVRGTDLLYSRIPMMIWAGWRSPVPFVTDHYRPWPDDWPILKPSIRKTAGAKHSRGLILHSDYAAGSYRRAGVPAEKLLTAHNGANPALMLPRLEAGEARDGLGLPRDRKIAVYAGRVNEEKGLDQVLALAALRPEVLFLLVGSEGEGPVERAAAGLNNVRVVPWQRPEALPAFLYAADVLLIPTSSAPLERFGTCVLPMKTFAYLASGRPILAPEAPDTAELLRDGDNALLVPPGEPEAAASALDRLLGEPELAQRLSDGALRTASELSWDHRAARISAFLQR